MYQIKLLNKIAEEGINQFNKEVYCVDNETISPDAIVVRSAKMHDMDIPDSLKAVARAGAGVNNIPIDKMSENGVVVFNTPGANANAVKELVIAGLLLSSRKIASSMKWVKEQQIDGDFAKTVEKNKSLFAGQEIKGKKLGIIGLGAIGVMVANSAAQLGMDVLGYDPYISVKAAWGLDSRVQRAESLDLLASECDYISLHLPLNDKTKGYVDKKAFSTMKDGVRLLNFARGELVDSDALREALDSRKCKVYITDFPGALEEDLVKSEGVVAMPHLGASTEESELNCARMAVKQLRDYLENGNIQNSVNFPDCRMTRVSEHRFICGHRNVPNMVGQITSIFAKYHINIDDMMNKSRGDYAYTIVDTCSELDSQILAEINAVENVLMARIV